VRTVCAYSLHFPAASAAAELWTNAATWIAGWYQANEPGATLPPAWSAGLAEPVRPCPDHELRCTLASVAGPNAGRLRELRWRFPDASDRSLLWTVDIAALSGDGAWFTLVLRIASADFELLPARFQLRTPRLIGTLVERGDAHIGVHRLARKPIPVDPGHVPELVLLLLEQSRRHPIVVMSPEPSTGELVIDPEGVAQTLVGLASVYVLTSRWATFALTDELGKHASCYNGAVRIYWPRFETTSDPFAHPLWLPPHIDELGGDDGFAEFLYRMIAGAASFRFVEPEPIRAYRARLEATRLDVLRTTGDYAQLDAHARELRARLDMLTAENEALRRDLAAHWIPATDDRGDARARASGSDVEPKTVLDAVEAIARSGTHVVFLADAFESARASPYRRPARVYSALLALDEVARAWAAQLAGGPHAGSRHEALRQRGFEYKDDISPTAEGRWGDEYTYLYEGKRMLFAPHITIGAKSADRCVSIHMYWDEARRRVAVAHVGRHKTNTRS
jgi:hypothetical protein